MLARYVLIPCFARLRVHGIKQVPATGAVVVACNHLNDADPVILTALIPRRVVFMAKAELFDTPFFGLVARAFGAIPVRRNQADLAALRRAGESLSCGRALAIFPEGRSTTSEARLGEAWPGAAIVALRNNAAILPVAITGSQRLQWPAVIWRIFRRPVVTVRVGAPFYLPMESRISSDSAAAGTLEIMRRIAALLPPEYRGYYGSSEPVNEPEAKGQVVNEDHPGE